MGVPIVLLHGFPFDGGMWGRQVGYLRGKGWRVETPDMGGAGVGVGRVVPGEAEASMEGYAEEVHGVIGCCGGKAIVGGFSMGGYVLLALLRKYPGEVAGVMLINTRAEADTAEGRAARLKSIEEVRAGGTAGLVETMVGRLPGKSAPEAVREEMRKIMGRQSAAAVIAAQSAMARRRDQTELLGGIQVPVLIVVGSEDVVTPPAAARAMHEKAAGSRLVEIAGLGHMVPLEAGERLGELMGEFAARV